MVVNAYAYKCTLLLNKLNFKTKGSKEFITQTPCVVMPKRSEGTTKGLRVINT